MSEAESQPSPRVGGDAGASVPVPGPRGEPPLDVSARRGVLCVKCEKLNETDVDKCARCHAHLYVFCQRCGEKNQRVHSRCTQCRKRLHRQAGERWKGGREPRPLNLVWVAVTVIVIVAAIVATVKFAGIRLFA